MDNQDIEQALLSVLGTVGGVNQVVNNLQIGNPAGVNLNGNQPEINPELNVQQPGARGDLMIHQPGSYPELDVHQPGVRGDENGHEPGSVQIFV